MEFEDIKEGMVLYSMSHNGAVLYVTRKDYFSIDVKYLKGPYKSVVIMNKNNIEEALEKRTIIDARESPGAMKMTIGAIFN